MNHGELQFRFSRFQPRGDVTAKMRASTGGIEHLAGIKAQRLRYRDRVAAEAKRHRRDEFAAHRRQPEIGGDRHGSQHMRHVKMTDCDPVAHICPGGLTRQNQIKPLGIGELHLARRHQNGGIDQRHESSFDNIKRHCLLAPSQKFGGENQAFSHIRNFSVLVHRRFSKKRISVLLRHLAGAHQNTLCLVHAFAICKRPSG